MFVIDRGKNLDLFVFGFSSIVLDGDSEIIMNSLKNDKHSFASYDNLIEEMKFLAESFVVFSRGVHGSGWVGLRGFFDPTHHGGSKKIQPNLTHHISPTQPT